MKLTFFILSILLLTSCGQGVEINQDNKEAEEPTDKQIDKIANEFCNCCDSVMKSNEDHISKKVKIGSCFYTMENAIDSMSRDTKMSERYLIESKEKIKKLCPNYIDIKYMFSDKTEISNSLKQNPNKCKDYFKDGDYVPVGINSPIVVTRKGTKNIVKYGKENCESVSDVLWVNDCEYYLTLRSSTCKLDGHNIGDQVLVKVTDIRGDTIYYELKMGSGSFPQMMRRVK